MFFLIKLVIELRTEEFVLFLQLLQGIQNVISIDGRAIRCPDKRLGLQSGLIELSLEQLDSVLSLLQLFALLQ